MSRSNKSKFSSSNEIFLFLLAVLCFSYAFYIAVRYANQIPLERHSFRQTQTALTAYWLIRNGFRLAYETPFGGPPWSIPFEFPIYQYIVALVSQVTNYSLSATGRIVSFLFLALCLIPARSITKNLNLTNSVYYIFAALLFSSPLYLFWGRSFMIETAALFFSVVAIKYFIDILQGRNSSWATTLYLVFIILSILQKPPTGLPVLAILSLVYLILSIRETNSLRSLIWGKKTALAFIYFGVPLIVGIAWVAYSDQVKQLNALGTMLTSSNLSGWNWGNLNHRLSSVFYVDVIWSRIFVGNLSGALGLAVLAIGFLSSKNRSIRIIISLLMLFSFLPLYLFTNLHIVHDYYQSANVIFLIYAVALSIGSIADRYFDKRVALLSLTIIMVGSNYFVFYNQMLPDILRDFNTGNSRDIAISEILSREIPQENHFIAFGNDWSSTFSYLSERKSFTVPPFFREYESIARNPENFIDETRLGGVVACPNRVFPTISELSRWVSAGRNWKIGEVHGCYVAIPEAEPLDTNREIAYPACQGSLDFAEVAHDEDRIIITVHGWTTISGADGITPEMVYVTLAEQDGSEEEGEPVYFETLQTNRPDVNTYFERTTDDYSGFSRVIGAEPFAGEYMVGVARLNQGNLEVCPMQRHVSIESGPAGE